MEMKKDLTLVQHRAANYTAPSHKDMTNTDQTLDGITGCSFGAVFRVKAKLKGLEEDFTPSVIEII